MASPVYDAAGRQIAGIDPLSRQTTSVYSSDNKLIASISADGARSTANYDAAITRSPVLMRVAIASARPTTPMGKPSRSLCRGDT